VGFLQRYLTLTKEIVLFAATVPSQGVLRRYAITLMCGSLMSMIMRGLGGKFPDSTFTWWTHFAPNVTGGNVCLYIYMRCNASWGQRKANLYVLGFPGLTAAS
jgi:hypothetical protein